MNRLLHALVQCLKTPLKAPPNTYLALRPYGKSHETPNYHLALYGRKIPVKIHTNQRWDGSFCHLPIRPLHNITLRCNLLPTPKQTVARRPRPQSRCTTRVHLLVEYCPNQPSLPHLAPHPVLQTKSLRPLIVRITRTRRSIRRMTPRVLS